MSEDQTGEIKNTPSHDEPAVPSTATEAEAKQAEVTEEPKVKKPNKVQERINQLTREKHEARQKNAELEKRLEALETNPAETEELVAPKEDGFENYSEFQNAQSDYISERAANAAYDRLKKENDNRDTANRQVEREKELSVKQKAFFADLESKRSNFEDFEGVAYGHTFMDADLAEQLFDINKGVEVAYHLGSNLEEAERIFNLPSLQRARELTKLEFSVEAVTQKKVSDAPDPITPLGNSESVQDDPDDMPTDKWLVYRNKQVHG